MKHYLITTNPKVFLYLFLSFFVQYGYAQCPAGNVVFLTQAEVDGFSTSCTDMTGSLTIGPSTDITDLSNLVNIVSIANDFTIIDNTMLTDLSGLGNSIAISGDLTITGNVLLSNCNIQSVCDFISTVETITLSGNNPAGGCNSVEEIIGIPIAEGTVIELDQDRNEVGSLVIVNAANNVYVETVCSGGGGRLKTVSSSTSTDNCGNEMYFHVNVIGNGVLDVDSQSQDVSYTFSAALNDTDLFPLVNNSSNTQYVTIKVTPFFDIDNNSIYDSSIDVEGTEFEYKIAVLPTPNVASSNSPICDGDDLNLMTDGGSMWNWSGPDSFTSTDQNPTISLAALVNEGEYYVTITNANGCTKIDTTDVVVNALPVVTIDAITSQCVDASSVALTGSPIGGMFNGTGVTGTNFDPSTSGVGTHTVTYTYTDGNGCENTAMTDVVVTALPVVTIDAITSQCVDASSVALIGSPTGGTFSGTGVSGTNFDPSTAGVGTHTVTYTYTDGNGCENTSMTDVVVNALPTVTIDAITSQCVDGSPVALIGSPTGGTFSGTGVSGTNFDPSTSGVGTHTITYTYTDGNGCENTAMTDVVVNALPTADAGMDQTICESTTATLTATGGDSYLWNTSETTATIDVVPTVTTTYSVIVTDANGCEASDDIVVTVIPNILPEITGVVEELDAMSNVINGSTSISATSNNPYSVTVCSGQGGRLTNVSTNNPVDNCGKPLFVTVNIIGNADLGVATSTTDVPYAQIGTLLPAILHPLVNMQSTTQYVSIKATPFYDVDGSGDQSTADVIGSEITYNIAVEAAPQAVCQDIMVELDDTGNISISENDIDNGSIAPCGLASLVVMPTSFDCSNIGTNTVTLTITDDSGNTSTCNAIVTVSDDKIPMATEGTTVISNFDFMSDFTMEGCGTETTVNGLTLTGGVPTEILSTDLPVGLTFTDACGIDKYEYWETQSNTDLCSANGVHYIRIFKAFDINGNTTVVKRNIYIKDTTAPSIVGSLTTTSVEGCSLSVLPDAFETVAEIESATGNVVITDNCTSKTDLVVTVTESVNNSCPIVVTREYIITDGCGKTNTLTHIININDTESPVVVNTLTNTAVEGCSISDAPVEFTTVAEIEAAVGGVTITDCSLDADLTVSSTETSMGTCPIVLTRTYTITDECSHSVDITHVINIDDNTAPVVTIQAQNMNVVCDGNGNTTEFDTWRDNQGGATVTDVCGNITWTSNPNVQDTDRSTEVVFTATDDCGNTNTTTASFIVDPIKPENISGYAVCKDGSIPANEGLRADCATCTGSTSVKWFSTGTSTVELAMGSPFDPTNQVSEEGMVDLSIVGTYTFYAECNCVGCPSERVAVELKVTEPIDMIGISTSVESICQGTDANPNLSFDLFVDVLAGTGPYTVDYTDGINNYTVSNYMSGDAIPIMTMAMIPQGDSYVELTYSVTNITGGCVTMNLMASSNITIFDCDEIPLDEYELVDPCDCKENSTTLTDGQFDESITLSAPSGQTWTVKSVSGLFLTTSSAPPVAPVPVTVGMSFTETAIPSTTIPGAVIYELKGIHVDGVGYTLTAENLADGWTSSTVSNTCYYPNPEILDFPDVVCNNNIYEIAFLGRADRGDGSGIVIPENEIFEVLNSSGTVVFGPVIGGAFDPSSLPVGDYTVEYTFDAPDEGHGPAIGYPGCSQTVSKEFNITDCNSCEGDDCPYYLVLKDSANNGWDGAKLMVSLNEQTPATAYTISTAEGGLKIIQLCINSGGFIDLTYMEGANNPEHSWYLVNSLGVIVNDMSGHPVNYVGSHTEPIRIKAQCPESTCIDTQEDYIVRVTMGPHPEAQSWEITRYDGTRAFHLNADDYAGLAPGTQVDHTVSLDLCEAYTITLQASDNGVFSAGGKWELISDNVDYGTQILNSSDSHYGASQIMDIDFPNLAANVIRPFTIPCKANCPTEVMSSKVIQPINGACYNEVNIPLVQPEICYPYRNHGLGCTITENIYLLENGLPYQSTNLTQLFEGGGINPTDPTMIANWDNFTNHYGMQIPVGCHKLVYELTYCDGIITKCTTDLILVSDENPSVTGNDDLHISLAQLDDNPAEGGWDLGYADDYGECVIKVLADMVLEMPTSCVDDFNSEFIVTLKDADGNLITQYGQDGLPLDAAGNSIHPALANVTDVAHDLIGPDQVGQTLTYIVEHKWSHTKTWGHILVEDKTDPIIICHDYDLECTHPFALDENYSHTDVLTPPATEMPANIAGGTAGVQSNTWIPVNLECARLGEVIQEVCVNLDVDHNMYQDLIFVLHSPTGLGIAPIVINSVSATNEFCFTEFNGKACKDAESTVSDVVVLENVGNQKPALYGKTWYLEVIDNRATGTVFGGGEIPTASLSLKCGFPTPYDAYDCTLQSVTLVDESIKETLCDQSDWNGAYIERTWQAIDAYGNSSVCVQRVNLKAPPLSEINLPEDVVLECDGVLTPETTIPAVSGAFSFGCNTPFSSAVDDAHGLCDFTYTYSDVVFWTCHNSYSIERTWTYGNWCRSVYKTHVQIIDVKDTTPPEIALDTIRVSTGITCTADVAIDLSGITDGCSQIQSITGIYSGVGKVYNPNGVKYYVDLLTESLEGLPLGVTEVNVIAKDSCLNESMKLVVIIVEDKTPPSATCTDMLNTGIVQVGDNGHTKISADQIGNGNTDNCSDVTLQIRRLDGCLGESEFGEFVYFECCDTGDTINVELLVTDEAGNSNTCTSEVFVQGVGDFGIISVPDDVTIECGSNLPDVDTDEVVLNSICNSLENLQITTSDSIITSDMCNLPIQVDRKWIVSNGDTSYIKVQHIYYELLDEFIVDFPEEITLTGCPDTIPTNAGRPIITSKAKCSQISINFEDNLFEINGTNGACYYLERVWTIHNDCIYKESNTNTDLGNVIDADLHIYKDNGDGYFQYTQIINVIDTEAPIVNCPDTLVYLDTLGLTNTCSMNVKLELDASDACTNFEYLTYMYELDLNNDGTIDESGEATDNSIERELEYGTHSIRWMVSDGCGNMSMCSTIIHVRDAKKPTPVCISLAVPLMDLGSNKTIRILAVDLLKYATDNCTDSLTLQQSVRIRREGTTDSVSTKILYDCNDIGSQVIEVWVTDEAGNSDYCTVSIEIQGDCDNICIGTMTRDTIECGAGGTEGYYCLDIPEADFSNYLVMINEIEVDNPLDGCNPIGLITYDTKTLFEGVAPFILESVTIDGVLHTGTFTTLEQIRDSIDVWDLTTEWKIDGDRLIGKDIGTMTFHDSNPISISIARNELNPNVSTVNVGSVLGAFTEGSYEILVQGASQGCPDTIQLIVDCNNTGGRARISGKIETQYEEPIEDVMVYTDKAQTPSEEDGYYTFNNMFMDQSYTLTPVKDNKPLEGVSVSDILVLISHVLGTTILEDPYTIIAADVNKDKVVNVSDIIALRRLLLRIDDDFKKNTSWRFIDKSYQFKNPSKPLGEPFQESINIENLSHDMFLNDFVGVKIGDLNGTVSGFRSGNGLNLVTVNTALEAGKNYQIEITSANFTDVQGFIFALGFNTEKLEFIDIKAGILDMSDHSIGTAKLDDGILTCIWTGKENTVGKDETLFTIEFMAKASGKLGDWIQVSNRYVDAEACFGDTSCGDIQLGFMERDGSVFVKSDFRLYQNQPNPFEGYTVIGFELPSDEVATIKIFDVSGRTIKVITNHYTKGYNEIRVNRNTLNVTGVLYYQLETVDNIDTKKMVILK